MEEPGPRQRMIDLILRRGLLSPGHTLAVESSAAALAQPTGKQAA